MVNILQSLPVDSYLTKSQEYAQQMHNKAVKSKNTRNWTNSTNITDSHLYGKIGEAHFAYIVSLSIAAFPEPNYSVTFHGDKGIDFCYNGLKIDVKTCVNKQSMNRQEYLKIQVDRILADIYSLVVYYPSTKQCRYIGSVTASFIRQVCQYDSRCYVKKRNNLWYYWLHEQLIVDNFDKNIYKMLKKDI